MHACTHVRNAYPEREELDGHARGQRGDDVTGKEDVGDPLGGDGDAAYPPLHGWGIRVVFVRGLRPEKDAQGRVQLRKDTPLVLRQKLTRNPLPICRESRTQMMGSVACEISAQCSTRSRQGLASWCSNSECSGEGNPHKQNKGEGEAK